ncbi:nitroreductase [Paludibacterium denitrificans]|uniref:nitroreductase n=1 Tax=Paludibacterium denitrificans TaxID=2675226 RepID=UPI001E4F17E4|nr:nitroreductase [Paludibacterium denitrificans]
MLRLIARATGPKVGRKHQCCLSTGVDYAGQPSQGRRARHGGAGGPGDAGTPFDPGFFSPTGAAGTGERDSGERCWAPSGNNIQPWRVHVVCGRTRQRLVDAVCSAYDRADGSYQAEYHYYPREFFEPYLGRRRKSGWGLYGLLGIQKGETERMRAQHRKNFEFFGAPVGLMFSIDRRMEQGSWLDYGMFLQNVMLAASARGLATCAQGAWIDYHRLIADLLKFGEQEQLVCGMALGYPDPEAPENTLALDRAPLSEYVVVHD